MLLRCLDINSFELPDGRVMDVIALGHELSQSASGQQRPTTMRKIPATDVLTLVIPAQFCLATSVAVTKHEAPLLASTLPWTLEDRLIESPETLHFATGQINQGKAHVTVVSLSWMTELQAALGSANISPTAVVSEFSLLPWQEGQWTLLLEQDVGKAVRCVLRAGEYQGFVCVLSNLHFSLQLFLNENPQTPSDLVIYAVAELAQNVQQHLPALLQTKYTVLHQTWWQTIQPAISKQSVSNLLQGKFAPRFPWQHWWQQWRLVASLVLGLLVTDVVATVWQTKNVQQATAANDAGIVELFRSVQPDAVMVDPQLQLERAVAALGGNQHPRLTTLLQRMAPALEKMSATEIQSLDYNHNTGELQLVIVTDGFAAAEALRASLQALGLQTDLLGSSSEGSRSRSRLRVNA